MASHEPLARRHQPGLDIADRQDSGCRERHVTARPLPGESPAGTWARALAAAQDAGAHIVRHEVFGAVSARAAVGAADWPVTWTEGNGGASTGLDGMHLLSVAGVPVETITRDRRPVGRAYTAGTIRHTLFGDLRPADTSAPPPEQARQVFETLDAVLCGAGLQHTDLARTWLMLDDILGWYGPFNEVRTSCYRRWDLPGLPASTGIGGRNPAGAALAAGAWCVRSSNGRRPIREMASPLQGPAPEYGSSFARAVEIEADGLRRVLISGTASIGADGRTLFPGDIHRQIDRTLAVVRAILAARGLDLADATRATAYLRRPQDAHAFEAWRRTHGLGHWPVVVTTAVLCRDDLLFELELDAASARQAGASAPACRTDQPNAS